IAARCTGTVEERWEDEAINTLVERFKAQIEKINLAQAKWEAGESSGSPLSHLPFFGHRREIGQVIDLIQAYVEQARRRGVRRSDQRVTKRDVNFIYRPSSVLMTMSATSSNRAKLTEGEGEFDRTAIREIRKDFLDFIKKEGVTSLSENFNWEAVKSCKELFNEPTRTKVHEWMKECTRDKPLQA